MTLEHVERGRLLLSEQNRLIDQVNANTPVGAAGAAWASGSHGAVLLVPPRRGAIYKYFELYDSLAPGNSAEAYPMDWDADTGLYVTDTDEDTFTVYDVGGRHRGRGRDEGASAENDSGGTRGKHGSKGLTVYRNGRWEIEWLQEHAQWIICLVASDFVTGDANISVDTVVVTGPTDVALLMSDVTEVDNLHSWAGAAGQTLQARWDDSYELWRAAQKDCGSGGVGSGV